MLTTRRAFTLMELLIVIGVIAILVGLALAIGAAVSGAGKQAKTQELLKVLDTSLSEFIASSGGIPGPTVVDPRPNPNANAALLQPVADAWTPDAPGCMINSVGLYMVQCESQPSAAAVFKSLDAKFIRKWDPDGSADPNAADVSPWLSTAFDGWDRPIRYVHPAFDGLILGPTYPNGTDPATAVPTPTVLALSGSPQFAVLQIRRNNKPTPVGAPTDQADSDGGICRAGRPYFYSAGADGDPSTVADNVYTTKPEFEKN